MIKKEFMAALRSWRGGKYRKEAAQLLSITERRYRGWEAGERDADPIVKSEMLRRMRLQE